MVEILGEKYITEKEAASLVGYSAIWLKKLRFKHAAPEHMRVTPNGRIYYPKKKFEKWIATKMKFNI